mmetsp:Transcript_82792/g.173327  ORF Transcript_82792/g.173327 Transcript_82792/m.173327 type:complete len:226 (+) Transcript_82792:41-718(+)|eukprot:CAMPEP_0206453734 /NCGR_PEP_ID=MMETSP0324_2-20121206/20723_1 /ASSEMBLY_ACC=CAM_ASM_000836 /TAXON_ID=2866 /ORGANISM="Crypthecodinium cohnii, Strain Seligo" /LENGTH=225 /DNA_ID=CAMNT_0053924083 /DNA_START=38 /DNA_END=715 /DNA_ORIENTATION=-
MQSCVQDKFALVLDASKSDLTILYRSRGWLWLCNGQRTTLKEQLGDQAFDDFSLWLAGLLSLPENPLTAEQGVIFQNMEGRVPDGRVLKAGIVVRVPRSIEGLQFPKGSRPIVFSLQARNEGKGSPANTNGPRLWPIAEESHSDVPEIVKRESFTTESTLSWSTAASSSPDEDHTSTEDDREELNQSAFPSSVPDDAPDVIPQVSARSHLKINALSKARRVVVSL